MANSVPLVRPTESVIQSGLLGLLESKAAYFPVGYGVAGSNPAVPTTHRAKTEAAEDLRGLDSSWC